ncbi:MAG: TRAP transporter substrate-binding protein [Eubacteriales bacterium]|nr:TRAP transporter substrate-binding protein [Eubacteriales bacterium]
MKNVSKALLLLLVLALGMFATACSNVASADDTIELSFAHFFSSTHPAEKVLVQEWAKAISEATDGKIKIVSYPGETLLKAANVYSGVVDGIADIGMSCFSYTRDVFPVLEGFEIPGVDYNSASVAGRVAWEGIKQLNPKEIQDTKLMMVIATGSGDLFTKEPVTKLEDLQGMTIRGTGLSASTIKLLGGTPIAMPQSDVFEALQKGVVKGNLGPVEVLKGWNHAEVTKYLTKTPFLYNTLFFVTMNLEKWNSIPKEIQDKILQVNETILEEVGFGLWDMQNAEALDYAVNERGMQVINLSDEETARWKDKVRVMQEEYSAKIEGQGLSEIDVMQLIIDLAEKFNAED